MVEAYGDGEEDWGDEWDDPDGEEDIIMDEMMLGRK